MSTRRQLSAEQQQRWMVAFWLLFILANVQLVFMIWLLADKRTSFIREPNPFSDPIERFAWFWIVPGWAVDFGVSAVLAIFGLVGLARARQGYSPWSTASAIWVFGHAALILLDVWALRYLHRPPPEHGVGTIFVRMGLENVPILFWLYGVVEYWFQGRGGVQAEDGGKS